MRNKILAAICLAMLAFAFNLAYWQELNDKMESVQTVPLILPHSGVDSFDDIFDNRVIIVNDAEMNCMARNIYFEARNQSDEAMAAVGYIILNRVLSPRYPDTVCGVVYKGRKNPNGSYKRFQCHFSWVCDNKPDTPNLSNIIEAKAWERAERIAMAVFSGTVENTIGKATMYHATYVSPYWKKAYERVAVVDDHIFYQKRG